MFIHVLCRSVKLPKGNWDLRRAKQTRSLMGYGECGGADGVLMMNLILRSIIAHGLRTWGGPARQIMELHGGHSFQSIFLFNYNRTNTCFRLTQKFQHLSSFKITYHSDGLISFLSDHCSSIFHSTVTIQIMVALLEAVAYLVGQMLAPEKP